MWSRVLWVFLVSRVLYGVAKATLALGGRIIHAPRSESQYRQWTEAVCKVYEGQMSDGTDAVTMALHTRWWCKRGVWLLAVLVAASLVAGVDWLDPPVTQDGVSCPPQVPFIHQLLDMPECRDAHPNDTHCLLNRAWDGPTERRFYVDDDGVWFSTRVVSGRAILWQEALLGAASACQCVDEALQDNFVALQVDNKRVVLYDVSLLRTQHDGSLVVSYSTPLVEWTSRDKTLLRDYNRRTRPHNWTTLHQLRSQQATLRLQGEAAACFARCVR